MGFDEPSVQEELRGFGRCYVDEAEGGESGVRLVKEDCLCILRALVRFSSSIAAPWTRTSMIYLEDEWTGRVAFK